MSRVPIRSRLRIDPYIVALLAAVAVASLLPARGVVATGFDYATTIAIGFLFFLYGARLSPSRRSTGSNTGGCTQSYSPAPSCCSRCWAWPRSHWCPVY
jgi:predicted permease